MQCLYCKKKLGLFASRKMPFCSDEHEAAYNEQQAGIALKRVLDPMFTERLPKTPLSGVSPAGARKMENAPERATPPFTPPSHLQPATPLALTRQAALTPPAPEEATFVRIVTPPPQASLLRQPWPIPQPYTQTTVFRPFGVEPLGGETELPEGLRELIEDPDQTAEAAPADETQIEYAQPQETAPEAETAAPEADPLLDSHRLHPVLVQEKPAGVEQEQTALSLERPLDFRVPILKIWPLALERLAAEPQVVAEPEDVAEPQNVAEPEGMVEPEATAETWQAVEEIAPAMARDAAPTPLSNQLPNPPAAGLVRSDPLRLQQAEEPRRGASEPPGVIDPQLTLRYPSARISIDLRALGQAAVRPAEAWQVQTLQAPRAAGQKSCEARRTDERIPNPPPVTEARRFALAPAQARFGLPQQARQAGLPSVRWKVFTALREAPAKLRMPQADSHPQLFLVYDGVQFWPIALHATAPGNAPVRAAGEIVGATVTVNLPTAPAEVLAANAETKITIANWAVLEPQAQADRRHRYRPSSLLAGSYGFQRARAASYIQVQEPELRQGVPRGLPWGVAGTAWRGVRPSQEALPLRAPVPLHPVVQCPEWSEEHGMAELSPGIKTLT